MSVAHAKFQKTVATNRTDHPAKIALAEALEGTLPVAGSPI
jgi:hypothetical protein